MPQSHPQVSLVDRQGISLASLIFTRDLQWIFREQSVSDVGIDAIGEIVSAGSATGNLLGLQIKSGNSFFAEPAEDGFLFRGRQPALRVLAAVPDPSSPYPMLSESKSLLVAAH